MRTVAASLLLYRRIETEEEDYITGFGLHMKAAIGGKYDNGKK
jgi:hypothetical protein